MFTPIRSYNTWLQFFSVAIISFLMQVSAIAQKSSCSQKTLGRYRNINLQGNAIKRVTPIYPEEAKKIRIGGTVLLRVVIDEEGKVSSAKVICGPRLLRKATLEAVEKWEFSPTKLGGKPLKAVGTMEFSFSPDARSN